ncbi:MAG: S1C family serine protease [Rhodoferax sp.]
MKRDSHLYSAGLLWCAVALLALLLLINLRLTLRMAARAPTPARAMAQKDIDAAVLKTLETTVLPSPASAAYDTVAPSVVRVIALEKSPVSRRLIEREVGAGVVVTANGTILTSLHVVQGARAVRVVFSNGLESLATIIHQQPQNDVAVLMARKVPADLAPATLRSTADLGVGDQVITVGFPFGIGPSVSAGVVSGLDRSFRSPGGRQDQSNLIQFDAAANPGNSGGPLVSMDGAVVGIVTAILNPTAAHTSIGIGFAVPIETAAPVAGLSHF